MLTTRVTVWLLDPVLRIVLIAGAVIFILLVDVGQFVVSYGLWKMKKWSYYIEIGVIIFNTSLRIVDMLLFPPLLFGLGIPIAVILYLRSKRHLFL